jgi:glycosyltransferase involved in cell wall biosynthesis
MIRLSIVTPVLNSHEIVRRQLIHYNPLPDGIELILVDDGSNPPITGNIDNLRIIPTNDYNKWTEHIARNIGVSYARGEYIFLIDIDYIIPRNTLLRCLDFTGDRKPIRRQFGILDEEGKITTDADSLKKWGLKDRWVRKRSFPGHRSQFLMRKKLFFDMRCYNGSLDGKWRKTGGAGEKFWRKWKRLEMRGKVVLDENPLDVYMFPSGKYCDFEVNFFHGLKK